MPACFQLTRKSNVEAGPVSLALIDDEICNELGVEPDPNRFLLGWVDSIGLRLAMGKSFEQIENEFLQYVNENTDDSNLYYSKLLDITILLHNNFTSSNFYSLK